MSLPAKKQDASPGLVHRFNYHVREDEGGWHQHVCCDVVYSDGRIDRGRKQVTLYSYDYAFKEECVDDASDLAAYFNAKDLERPAPE